MAIEELRGKPEFEPYRVFNIDLIKDEQDRRVLRRIGPLKGIIGASKDRKDEGFRKRTRDLIELYEKNLREGTNISQLADAVFIQGIIRGLDQEIAEYWDGNLRKLREKNPSVKDLDKLIEVLPITFSHIALKEGLAEKIDGMIRECKDPSRLLGDINKALAEAEHVSVDNLVDDYRFKRYEQIRTAPQGMYHRITMGLDKIFEGLVVPPTGEKVGRDPEYQWERLDRRRTALGDTDFKDYQHFMDFEKKFKPIMDKIKGGEYGPKFGRALMLQAMNIYLTTLGKNWMNEKIDMLSGKGKEETISDLRNLADTLAQVGRSEGLLPEIVGKINACIKEVEALPKEEASERIEGLRKDINKKLTGRRYKSHSGIEDEPIGTLPTLFPAYEKEHLYLLGKIKREEIEQIARETLKGVRSTGELKEALLKIVESDEHGLAEAEAITRRIMDSGRVKNFSNKEKEELEGHIGDRFRERRDYIRDLNELMRILGAAAVGAGEFGTFRSGSSSSIPAKLLGNEPKIRKLVARFLGKKEEEITVEDVDKIYSAANFAYTTLDQLDKIWYPKPLTKEESASETYKTVLRKAREEAAFAYSKECGPFKSIINPVIKRSHMQIAT